MAESKKNAAVGKPVKTEPETVTAVKKTDIPEKKEEVKAAKKETKKAPIKKTVVKKAAEKKPAAEKTEVKAEERKAEVKREVHLQFAGKSYSTEDLQKIAADVWKYDLHKEEEYTSLELYVKPEEDTVYYVFNGNIAGSFRI